MASAKKTKKWMLPRHRVVRNIAYVLLTPYAKWKYGIKIERFREQGDRQYLILMNHQTAFDQFFVGMAFHGPIYYVASEDLFSKGILSRLIRYLVNPIPIKKQTTDVRAVMNCIRVAREGGTIAIAPEGNRTYGGRQVYIKPAIVPLARKLGLPIILYRIEGGYGTQPRWSDTIRRGPMRAYVSEVIEPEEYASLNDDALYTRITTGLDVDETAIIGEYPHKKLAEYLERAIYVCPQCGLSVFESHGDVITCQSCGRRVRYLPNKTLEGIGCDFPFRFIADWYDYQCDFVRSLDLSAWIDQPMYRDSAQFSEVILYQSKKLLQKETELSLYGDRIVITSPDETLPLPFDSVSAVTVLGRNKLNVYVDGHVYQLKGCKRFNALKYVNIFYHYKNKKEGDHHGKFLGL